MKTQSIPHYSPQTALRYLGRASRLKCPVCGKSPIFKPLSQTRGLKEWFTPVEGCPICQYKYDREPGYFLMSIWAINYGVSAFIGIAVYLYLEWKYELPVFQIYLAVAIPMLVFSILFARHSKAFFLAIDHFLDPGPTVKSAG